MSDAGFSYANIEFDDAGYVKPIFSFEDRTTFFDMAAKKDAVKLPSTGQYYYNVYEQLFTPVDQDVKFELDQLKPPGEGATEDERYTSFVLEKAPTFAYSLQQDPNTFNGFIARAIWDGGFTDPTTGAIVPVRTPEEIDFAVDWAKSKGTYGMTLDITNHKAFAKDLFVAWQGASRDFDDENEKFFNSYLDVYKKRGLPSPDLRYDPRTVPEYQKWEDQKVSELKSRFGSKVGSKAIEDYRNRLRSAATEEYAKQGYSPYYDAILRARAGS